MGSRSKERKVKKSRKSVSPSSKKNKRETKDDNNNDDPMEVEVKDQQNDKKDEDNLDTWDHSDRRVMVYNVQKFMNNKDIPKLTEKWLSTLDDPKSIEIPQWRKAPNSTWLLLTCKTKDMAAKLIKHINDTKITNPKTGKELLATTSESKNKRSRDDDDENSKNKKNKDDNKEPETVTPLTDDQVRDKLTPLWKMSYEDQIEEKKLRMIKKCSIRVIKEIKKKFTSLAKEAKRNPKYCKATEHYDWLTTKGGIEVLDIIPSPTKYGYRNKCEFTFGYRTLTEDNDDKDKEPTRIPSVGCMAGGWSGGVSRPHMCSNMPWEACALSELMETFLKESPIPVYDNRSHVGLWRVMTIRTSRRTKECMVVIQHAPPKGGEAKTQTEDYTDAFQTEKKRLVKLLTSKKLPKVQRPGETSEEDSYYSLKVTSVFFQEYGGLSNPPPEYPVQHAHGKKHLTEILGKCKFRISPGAFFQVNTACAEVLYQIVVDRVKEVTADEKSSLLFDVCCGTGSIGLTCKKQGAVSNVIGVDISQPAIDDANANVELNKLHKSGDIRFIASKAEDVMRGETYEITKEDNKNNKSAVVAVCDPARDGLHPNVVRELRGTEKIQRIVYVSCNPTGSLIPDAVILCQPPTKRYPGLPFKPTYVQPVDMFPHTDHCELVMVFDRLTEEETESSGKDKKDDDKKESKKEEPKKTETKKEEPKKKVSKKKK